MSWITDNICKFITDFIGSTIDLFGETINNIFFLMVKFNEDNEYVKQASSFMVVLALALVSALVIKQVISGYLLETDYDSDADPFDLIVRIVQTVAVICCSSWLFDYLLSLSRKFASDLIKSTSVGVGSEMNRLLQIDPEMVPGVLLAYILMLVIMLVLAIVFTVVSGLRGCELIAMKVFMPLFALDLLTTNRERWNNFFTGYLIAFFSYAVQILFFNIALKCMMSSSYTKPQYMLGTMAWFYLAIKAPKFMEKYLYKSGVSKAASGGVRMVVQTAIMKG